MSAAGFLHLFTEDKFGQTCCVPWHRKMKVDTSTEELPLFRRWLKTARQVCGSASDKDPSKLRCNELMREVASALRAAGVPDEITAPGR